MLLLIFVGSAMTGVINFLSEKGDFFHERKSEEMVVGFQTIRLEDVFGALLISFGACYLSNNYYKANYLNR